MPKKQSPIAQHWDTIYHKPETECSWYEPVPVTSISFIDQAGLPKDAAIIDIGGGDGTLARHLLAMGYEDITILDISLQALERGQKRLGELASRIKWIHSNILDFEPTRLYDCWHDRATFHFLVNTEEQLHYLRKAHGSLSAAGQLILATFSENGPARCSGLPVQRFSETTMTDLLKNLFKRNKCIVRQHITPLHTLQEFIFCRFKKI
jgi:ubiquinone/menaquinone biosynthesis C-methylase UbiE